MGACAQHPSGNGGSWGMKLTLHRVVAFFLLIALSIGFGFAWDAAATAVERHRYPLQADLSTKISQHAEQYGIPEPVLWAAVRNNSSFASNAVAPNGAVGLMQITPERFEWICLNLLGGEPKDIGMLFDPDTNLSAGCAYLSYLYDRYGIWAHAFGAYFTDPQTMDAWLNDTSHLSEQGVLQVYPNRETADYVKDMVDAVKFYSKLYYET